MADYNKFDKVDYAQILFMQIERCTKTKTLGLLNPFVESVELLEALLPYCESDKQYIKEIDKLKANKNNIQGNMGGLPKKQRDNLRQQEQGNAIKYYFAKFRALIRYADRRGLLIFKVVSSFE